MVTSLEAAYASCEHTARSHYENFPVASWLVPAPMRRHVAALYAFARAADSLVEKTMYGRSFIGPARAAFVLDRDGTVLAVAEKVDTSDHAAQLREMLRRL